MERITPTYHIIRLELSYKIPFTAHEVWFLNHFIPPVMVNAQHIHRSLLELCNLQELYRKQKQKFDDVTDCKLKMTAAELIALKRLLLNTEVPFAWKREAEAILAKLDQLTVGIR